MIAVTQIDMGSTPFIAGLLLGLFFYWLFSHKRRFRAEKHGIFVGGNIRELGSVIDSSKRYDVVCMLGGDNGSRSQSPSRLRQLNEVAFLGYTGSTRGDSFLSSYLHSRGIVLGLKDGRQAYVLPRSIKMIIECKESVPAIPILPPPLK
jgi:hypothetical protein